MLPLGLVCELIASYCYTFLGHTSRTDGESVVQETAAGELQEMNYQQLQQITCQTNQNRFRIYTIVHSMYFADAFCMFCKTTSKHIHLHTLSTLRTLQTTTLCSSMAFHIHHFAWILHSSSVMICSNF